MQREIKFRAFIAGKMVNNVGFHPFLMLRHHDDNGELMENEQEGCMSFTNSEEMLMQFTGLLDKNGKEIYEGDILKEGDCLFIVEWDSQWAKFKLKSIGHIQYPEWNRGIKMEIIGNIYQNKELLK